MIRTVVIINTVVITVFSKSVEQNQVRTGIVPIFDGRVTNEPVTFTYTTASPSRVAQSTVYPVQFEGPRFVPTLSTINHKESLVQTNYNLFNEKWQYSPAQAVMSNDIRTTRIYNQAQYYRAMQAGRVSTPPAATSSPYEEIWAQINNKWQKAKHTLVDSGIEKDWRSLWGKLSGALEPFMAEFAEQMGRMMNTFMRQQNIRIKELQRPDLSPFRLFRDELSSNDDVKSN